MSKKNEVKKLVSVFTSLGYIPVAIRTKAKCTCHADGLVFVDLPWVEGLRLVPGKVRPSVFDEVVIDGNYYVVTSVWFDFEDRCLTLECERTEDDCTDTYQASDDQIVLLVDDKGASFTTYEKVRGKQGEV